MLFLFKSSFLGHIILTSFKMSKYSYDINLPRTDKKGFTLIELIVVMLMIGILASIALMQFLSYRERGYNATLQSDLRSAYTASKQFYMDNPNGVFSNAALANEKYGYVASDDVILSVEEGEEEKLRIIGSHPGTPNDYQVDYAGRVSKKE